MSVKCDIGSPHQPFHTMGLGPLLLDYGLPYFILTKKQSFVVNTRNVPSKSHPLRCLSAALSSRSVGFPANQGGTFFPGLICLACLPQWGFKALSLISYVNGANQGIHRKLLKRTWACVTVAWIINSKALGPRVCQAAPTCNISPEVLPCGNISPGSQDNVNIVRADVSQGTAMQHSCSHCTLNKLPKGHCWWLGPNTCSLSYTHIHTLRFLSRTHTLSRTHIQRHIHNIPCHNITLSKEIGNFDSFDLFGYEDEQWGWGRQIGIVVHTNTIYSLLVLSIETINKYESLKFAQLIICFLPKTEACNNGYLYVTL